MNDNDVNGKQLFTARVLYDIVTFTVTSFLLVLNRLNIYAFFIHSIVTLIEFIVSVVKYVELQDYLDSLKVQPENVKEGQK